MPQEDAPAPSRPLPDLEPMKKGGGVSGVGVSDDSGNSPKMIRYAEKIKARLAAAHIAGLIGLSILWTFRAPQLSAEMVGIIIGAFTTSLGAIGHAYWGSSNTKP